MAKAGLLAIHCCAKDQGHTGALIAQFTPFLHSFLTLRKEAYHHQERVVTKDALR